jgi:hypothetical protein
MCRCTPLSPFLWHKDKSPTIFAKDKYFSPGKQASAYGATMRIEAARASGEGFEIHGLSKNREAEILRVRTFSTFGLAVAKK